MIILLGIIKLNVNVPVVEFPEYTLLCIIWPNLLFCKSHKILPFVP